MTKNENVEEKVQLNVSIRKSLKKRLKIYCLLHKLDMLTIVEMLLEEYLKEFQGDL